MALRGEVTTIGTHLCKALAVKVKDPICHDVAVAGGLDLLHIVRLRQLIETGEDPGAVQCVGGSGVSVWEKILVQWGQV